MVDRQSSVNTVSSSSSKASLVLDATAVSATTGGINDRSGLVDNINPIQSAATAPTPNEQFTAWLRIGTQQNMDHHEFIKSSKSPSTKTGTNVPSHNTGSNRGSVSRELTISTTMANIPNLDATSRVAAAITPTMTNTAAVTPGTPVVLDQDMFSRWVQAGNEDAIPTNTGTLVLDGNTKSTGMEKSTESSPDHGFGTLVTSTTSTTVNSSTNAYDGSTFQRIPTVPVGNDLNDDNDNNANDNTGSDNDSVIDDEQNTQVGANDCQINRMTYPY
jgi:hypothetical protein